MSPDLCNSASLNLRGTRVADLTPLAGLTARAWLNLNGTRVTNLAPLVGLTALTTLNLSGTRITDLAPLLWCPRLEEVVLGPFDPVDTSDLKARGIKIKRG